MDEVIKGVGDATDKIVSDENQAIVDGEGENKIIDHNTYKRLMGQLKKTQEVNETLASKVNTFESEKKSAEENKLAEQGEYKKLLEMRQAEVEQLKADLDKAESETQAINRTLSDAQKLQAVYDKLPGKLLNNQYAAFIDLEKIALNPETNEIDEQSVDLVVNSFMGSHKSLVDTSHVGRLPGDATRYSENNPLHHRFKDLDLKDMKTNITAAVRAARKERGI